MNSFFWSLLRIGATGPSGGRSTWCDCRDSFMQFSSPMSASDSSMDYLLSHSSDPMLLFSFLLHPSQLFPFQILIPCSPHCSFPHRWRCPEPAKFRKERVSLLLSAYSNIDRLIPFSLLFFLSVQSPDEGERARRFDQLIKTGRTKRKLDQRGGGRRTS